MTRKIWRSSLILLAAVAPLAGGILGCGKEEPPARPVVTKPVPKEQAKAAEAAKPAQAPAAKAAETVLYNPAGKRDPFVPFLKAETKTARIDKEGLPPLQRYELGELKFVGVIWGPRGAYALVEDAEGRGYTVTVGSKIGRGGGVVTRITDGEVLVKEEYRDFAGGKVIRESSMKLENAGGK
ncbi:MAG: pilus assembly protein PilP [Deltaproteobacteria bacterium]|nr:pilus assembly protein PilP [Candidatus Deferrimicrobiaceae bacterium]